MTSEGRVLVKSRGMTGRGREGGREGRREEGGREGGKRKGREGYIGKEKEWKAREGEGEGNEG